MVPSLPSAAMAIEAAASADAFASRAKQEYILVLKLKKVWDKLGLLLNDESFEALRTGTSVGELPEQLKTLAFSFAAIYSRYKEIENGGITETLDRLYSEVKSSPLLGEEEILEEKMEAISSRILLVSKEFEEKEVELRKINESLSAVWKMFNDFRVFAGNRFSKKGEEDPHVVLKTSSLLLHEVWSFQNRLHALESMQYVISYQWKELTLADKSEAVEIGRSLMFAIAGPLKDPILAFLHKLFSQAGVLLWKDLLHSLVTVSGKGPVEAEISCSIMKWLPTEYGTQADQSGIFSELLPVILPTLNSLMRNHYDAAIRAKERAQTEIALQHEAAVHSSLQAVNAFAVWAPLEALVSSNIVNGYTILSTTEFRQFASEFFRLVSSRTRPADAGLDYDRAMSGIHGQVAQLLESDSSTTTAVVGASSGPLGHDRP